MIGDVARIIISVTEKIESFIDLIVEGMEILVSQSSTIIDDVEIIVKETELIVTIVLSKGIWFALASSLSSLPIRHAACHF